MNVVILCVQTEIRQLALGVVWKALWVRLLQVEDCRTNVPGIYVAGDVRTKPLRQVITAVSDGAVAIASLEQDRN